MRATQFRRSADLEGPQLAGPEGDPAWRLFIYLRVGPSRFAP